MRPKEMNQDDSLSEFRSIVDTSDFAYFMDGSLLRSHFELSSMTSSVNRAHYLRIISPRSES